jgi:Cof subfamily protein (haloacid dehalogenase superfamily)
MNGFTPDPPIRLLVVDVDGTLVGADRQISPRVRRAVEESRRRGVQIALSTGRPWFGTKQYVDALQLDGFHIFDSGASIVNPHTREQLFRHGLDRAFSRDILAAVRHAGLHLEVYTSERYYVEEDTEHTRIHSQVMGSPPVIIPLDKVIEREDVVKMELVALNEPERAQVQALTARFAEHIDTGSAGAPGTQAEFTNILAKGVNKGEALARLAEHAAIPTAQVMAVGDGMNDEPMVRFAGVGVAMGDGPEDLKRIANWVTATVEQDGLALAIERYILGTPL